eukprot:4157503-Heterocapsa_arctica.AAC.1
MKKDPNYHNFSNEIKIEKMAAFMVDKKDERTTLSKLGASRLTRKEVLRFLHGKEKIQNYYTLMIQTTSSSGVFQLGYIMFEDLGNKSYMKALESNVTDPNALWLNPKHKGDVVECIM